MKRLKWRCHRKLLQGHCTKFKVKQSQSAVDIVNLDSHMTLRTMQMAMASLSLALNQVNTWYTHCSWVGWVCRETKLSKFVLACDWTQDIDMAVQCFNHCTTGAPCFTIFNKAVAFVTSFSGNWPTVYESFNFFSNLLFNRIVNNNNNNIYIYISGGTD